MHANLEQVATCGDGGFETVAAQPPQPPSVGLGLLGAAAPADAGLEEPVEVAVEHGLRVALLVAGPQVLDDLVGVQHVVAHLVAPARLDVAAQTVEVRLLLGLLQREQLGLEHDHRARLVLQLRLLVLAADHSAGRDVREAYGGVGRVDRLPTGTAGAVDVDADLLVGDVDLVGLLQHRHDLDRRERRLAAALVVERADPHQPVRAGLDRQRAVGVGRVDREGGGLEAGLLGVRRLVDLDRVAVLLGPADVHPHQRLGEVRGIDATGAGPDRDQRLAGVVLTVEEGADLEALDDLLELDLGVGERAFVALVAAELDHDLEVLDAAAERHHPVELALQRGEPPGDPGRALDVVPQVGCGHLLAEVGDLDAHRIDVEHLLDGVHGRLELLDLCVEVRSCHKEQGYAGGPPRAYSATADGMASSAQTRLPPVSPASIPHDAASAPTRCRPRPCSSVSVSGFGSGVPTPPSSTSMRNAGPVFRMRTRYDESAWVSALAASSLTTSCASSLGSSMPHSES